MKKILFPTDLSKLSKASLSYTANFCEQIGGELSLFHAMPAPVFQTDEPMLSTQDLMDTQKERIEAKLENMADKIRNEFNISVRAKAVYGFPADSITAYAEANEMDLIVLSAKGESNFLDKLFGNVTLDLFKKSETPILSIPEDAEYRHIKKIVFSSSNINRDAEEVFHLIKLTERFEPQIKLVHISKEKELEKETFEAFSNLEYVEIEGDEEHSVARLTEYMKENDIDLVCVKKFKLPFLYRIFHKSFTADLFEHTNKPLLVFKEESE